MKELEVNHYIDDHLKAIYELKINELAQQFCLYIKAFFHYSAQV